MNDAHLIGDDPMFSSSGIKKMKDDAVAFKVNKLIKENADEKTFDPIFTTIAAIMRMQKRGDGEEVDSLAHRFTSAYQSADDRARAKLRTWYALFAAATS